MNQLFCLSCPTLFNYYLSRGKDYMFHGASAFDQNPCRWNKDYTTYIEFCSGASCGTSACQPSSAPSQIPTLAPSKASRTFITGLIALCSIIAFEMI